MPLYEFACDACGARVEKIQKHSDPPPDPCPSCGKGPMVRQMSSPAIQFKGSGWYITDYAKKGGAAPDSGAAKAEKAEKTEKTDTKTETAAATKSESSPAPAAPKPSSES
jgi:putative FmdB family regulatory protein